MAEAKKKLPITIFELVAYIVLGLLALWGLVYIALGISCNFISYKSGLVYANGQLNLGFLYEGMIILAVSAVAASVVLLVNAKSSDREFEKEQRRAAARIARRTSGLAPQAETVVDAEVSEAKAE